MPLTSAKPPHMPSITATKSVSFRYAAQKGLRLLSETFMRMCNEAIKIAVQENPKNKFKLIEITYRQLKKYGLHTHYILSACEVAFSVYRNKKRKSTPCIRRPFIKLDSQSYRLDHILLRIPTTPKSFIFLTLRCGDYHLSFLDDPTLKRGSVTITAESVSIAFTKGIEASSPTGFLGMDVNEKNVTVSATDGHMRRFDEFGEVAEIKESYKKIRASISSKLRMDRRITKQLLAKYGRREKRRTGARVNKVTKSIVDYAREHGLGIKMEELTGIRRLYRKGNGQGTSFRGRMNSWVFGETQRQVEYKARWDGIPVWYVNPRGTSSHCLCGSHVVPLADRKLYCPKCDITWDRDDLASKNIMACAVPQARPSRRSDEGESKKKEDAGNPRSGWREGTPGG